MPVIDAQVLVMAAPPDSPWPIRFRACGMTGEDMVRPVTRSASMAAAHLGVAIYRFDAVMRSPSEQASRRFARIKPFDVQRSGRAETMRTGRDAGQVWVRISCDP